VRGRVQWREGDSMRGYADGRVVHPMLSPTAAAMTQRWTLGSASTARAMVTVSAAAA